MIPGDEVIDGKTSGSDRQEENYQWVITDLWRGKIRRRASSLGQPDVGPAQ